MGLPSELLQYFNVKNAKHNTEEGTYQPHSILEFARERNDVKNIFQIKSVCQKLVNEGLLFFSGNDEGGPPTNELYINYGYNKEYLAYGVYDFLIEGFVTVRNHFLNSVKPVIVKKKNGDPDIGTGFIISSSRFVTALHCIQNMREIIIPNFQNKPSIPTSIYVDPDEILDLAIIDFTDEPFQNCKPFQFTLGAVLDDVLTFGYPQIAGFDAVQIAEVSSISGLIKSSTGKIIAHDFSHIGKQDYFLINARVKGGHSGAPLINRHGMVVGMMTEIPSDLQDSSKLDLLGYGIATPGDNIHALIQEISKEHDDVRSLKFNIHEKGFATLL